MIFLTGVEPALVIQTTRLFWANFFFEVKVERMIFNNKKMIAEERASVDSDYAAICQG